VTGLGLFATAEIAKGAVIVEYKGRRISTAQAARLEARGARYLYEIDRHWTVDGSSRRNIARYANHSCRPNAESDVVRGKVILRAIKTIAPGDEITYDYGEYFELFSAVGCSASNRERPKARAPAPQVAAAAKNVRGGGRSPVGAPRALQLTGPVLNAAATVRLAHERLQKARTLVGCGPEIPKFSKRQRVSEKIGGCGFRENLHVGVLLPTEPGPLGFTGRQRRLGVGSSCD
jgi:hypothetical protein